MYNFIGDNTKNKNKKQIIFWSVMIITFLSLAIILTTRELQNDTFYTIKVGQTIFNNGIDMKEHFSFIPNLAYTYPHWLYDLAIYFIYHFAGFHGLYISSIVLAFALFVTLYVTTNKIVKDRGLSYFMTIILGMCFRNFITARAQLVSYIFLLLILYSIEMLRETGKKKYFIYIFVFSLLIANVHLAIWPFIFVLFLPYLVQDLVYYIKNKFKKQISTYKEKRNISDGVILVEEAKNTKKLLLAVLLVLVTGFLTPNFLVPFTYFYNTRQGVTMSYISEHLPITISNSPAVFIIFFALVFLLFQGSMKIKLKDFFFIGGLFLLSLLSNRSFALFLVLGFYSIARILKSFIDKRLTTIKLEDVIDTGYVYVSLSLFMILFSVLNVKSSYRVPYVNPKKYPIGVSTYIKNNLDVKNIKLFNEYNFGSYLLFEEIPVFYDSRADLYTEEFNKGCTAFIDGMKIFDNYKDTFSKYGITHVLIYNTNKLNKVLELDKNYIPIYSDANFTFYENLTNK